MQKHLEKKSWGEEEATGRAPGNLNKGTCFCLCRWVGRSRKKKARIVTLTITKVQKFFQAAMGTFKEAADKGIRKIVWRNKHRYTTVFKIPTKINECAPRLREKDLTASSALIQCLCKNAGGQGITGNTCGMRSPHRHSLTMCLAEKCHGTYELCKLSRKGMSESVSADIYVRSHSERQRKKCKVVLLEVCAHCKDKKRTTSIWNASTTPSTRMVHTIMAMMPVLFVVDLLVANRLQFGFQFLLLLRLLFLLYLLQVCQFASYVRAVLLTMCHLLCTKCILRSVPAASALIAINVETGRAAHSFASGALTKA